MSHKQTNQELFEDTKTRNQEKIKIILVMGYWEVPGRDHHFDSKANWQAEYDSDMVWNKVQT